MSVIQSIRDKYAKWAVIAIALALLGFILTDYFQAKERSGGGGNQTTIGTVNGRNISYIDFERKLTQVEAQAEATAQQQGRELSEADRFQSNEQLWNNEVEQIVMSSEFNKLGIEIGRKEFDDWLFGQSPPQDLQQRFADQQGIYDGAAARNAINQMKRSTNQAEKDQLESYLSALEYSRKLEKYNSLLTSSVYYPKWYVEKQNTEAAQMAKVSLVKYAYTKISDSTIKITDKEIEEFISKNKDQYKQEESRSIAYVVFDASPTSADTAATKKLVEELKPEFMTTTDPAVFLSKYGSSIDYYDGYAIKKQIQFPAKDSIFALAKGQVYGPYLDGGSFVMAKMIDIRNLADSVKCRHVLISADVSQGGFPDSVAAKKIDSVKNAINGGASWDEMVQKYNPQSDGSRQTKGEMTFSAQQIQSPNFAKEFAQFILFDGKKGERKVVKTSFGYHFIEIMDLMDVQPAYKAAYFAKQIVASPETEQTALEEANKFASESNDVKSFDANVAKSNGRLKKLTADNIRPNDIYIRGIDAFGTSRPLVRDIYKADKGDVLKQVRVGDTRVGYKYIVAVVTDVLKEGTQPAYIARPNVERILIDRKKGEQIKQMVGKVTTLEAAAAILKDSIITVDSLRITGGNMINGGKVLGAIFNPANKGKVIGEAIAGNDAAYVIRVDDITTTSVPTPGITAQQEQMRQRAKQMQTFYSSPLSIMRKTADISDKRRDFY